MKSEQFDDLTRALANGVSRRQVLKGLIGTVLGSLFGTLEANQFAAPAQALTASPSASGNPCQCYLNNTCPPPAQQSCLIQPYDTTGTRFIGKPILADPAFFGALDQINTCAVRSIVNVEIVSSFRSCRRQSIVNPTKVNSDHLVGHAIDMNVCPDATGKNCCAWDQSVKPHTGCLAQPFNKYPLPVQNFITCVKSMGLRWGGDFGPIGSTAFDPIHFDDDLFHKDPSTWLAKLNLAQASVYHCNAEGRNCVPRPCPTGEICTNDVCGCPTGLILCDGKCVNTQSDPNNCGACGNLCAAGQMCCAGACIDPQTDPNNCGACGTVCPSDQTCCQGTCTNTQTDPNNCGSCGTACPSGQTCCEGICTDTQTDPKNCGTCGTACPADATCVGGVCACPTGLTLCSGMCVNTQNNPTNCGACGVVCPAGTSCVNGICICPDGQPACNGVCCPAGQICTNGVCTCPDGRPACNGMCCPPELTCVNGVCACPDGQSPCNGVCCAAGQHCCGNVCCNSICCNGVCCAPGVTCCHRNGTCCAPGATCCGQGGCCDPPNTLCCGTNCCPPSQTCCNGHCCNPSEVCLNCGCCPADTTVCECNPPCCCDVPPCTCCGGGFCCSANFPICCGSGPSTTCCQAGTFCCVGGCCTAQGTTLARARQARPAGHLMHPVVTLVL